ncbi:MerR family transcriptional regulator [Kribbella italica]|uniref:DNA-binding transcriptional MerR regulator n=1 Tax=Kribbella italica TaxID=1540520 RepID=A0A7W9JEK0_9ACTN|nr:MerR family transcriptional regulator [Kribbella italica]MBB5840530.1 DNA-binding transcriptional MerR regulator [Kribbella italica]
MTTVDGGLRSGQVADAAGVNLQTLRYYERRGLLAEPDRSPGGHRLYPPEAVTVLRVIKAAQRLGFTLEEISDLLEAGRHHHGAKADEGLQARARDKLVDVEAKIADLTVIAASLRTALDAGCDDLIACAHSPSCPLPFADLAAEAPTGTHLKLADEPEPRRDCC